MKAVIRLVLLTALRDRLLTAMALLLAGSTALSVFLGGTVVTEQLQLSLSFAAAIGRFILVLGLTVFAAFHIQALFESREVEAILARAISRGKFVFSYWLGLCALAGLISGVFAAVIVALAGGAAGSLVWAVSLMAECAIIMAVVVFAGLMLERATSTVMFTLGFYALARLMGYFVGIRTTVDDTSLLTKAVTRGLDIALLFIPRLDLFAQTRWVVYGNAPAEWRFLGAEAPLFLVLVLAAATFDLRRKQF